MVSVLLDTNNTPQYRKTPATENLIRVVSGSEDVDREWRTSMHNNTGDCIGRRIPVWRMDREDSRDGRKH